MQVVLPDLHDLFLCRNLCKVKWKGSILVDGTISKGKNVLGMKYLCNDDENHSPYFCGIKITGKIV